jgi:type IV pilus assembly protein PilE
MQSITGANNMKFNCHVTPNGMRNSGGFTLIEVMVTVAIIAILAAVAYPSYQNYIIRANRSAAQSFMLEVSSRQERILLDARAYAANIAALGISPPPSVSANYTIDSALVAGPPPGYTITATPIPGTQQAIKDTLCAILTLDATGTKTASGSGGVAQCWKH